MAKPEGGVKEVLFRRPSFDEIKNPTQEKAFMKATTDQWKRPVLPPPEKKEQVFEGGHDLEIGHPLGSTKIHLSGPEARFFAGAGARMNDVKDRVQQLVGAKGAQERIDERRVMDTPLLETTAGAVGHMAPDVAALSFLNGPRAMSTLGSMGIGAAQGFSQPLTSYERDNNAGLVNAGMGAFGGGVGKLVGDTVANLAGKAVHAANVTRDPSQRFGFRSTPVWKDLDQRRAYELAQRQGVPTTIGDIDPFSSWHGVENMLENLPSGREKVLINQQNQMQRAIHDVRRRHGADTTQNAGKDIAEEIKKEHAARKKIASDMFKEVDEIAEATPNLDKVKPTNTYATAQEIHGEYPELFDEFKNNAFMRKILGIERDTGPQASTILNPATNTPFMKGQELEFKDAQYIRKRLGAWYADLNKKFERGTLSGAGNDAVAKAARLLKAVDDDLESWASQGAAPQELKDKWDVARRYFKEEVMPFRDPSMLESKSPLIRNIVNDNADTATLVDKTLPKRETSISADAHNLTTDEGRAAMRAALIDKLTRDSVQHRPEGFDTHSIGTNVDDFANTSKAVLTSPQRTEMQELADLGGLSDRSNNLLRGNSSFGERLPSYLLGGSAMLGIPSLAYMGASAFGPEDLSMAEKFGIALTLGPLAALAGSRAANKYTGSRLGQNFHFIDPALEGVPGALQRFGAAGVRGAGAPLTNEFERQQLGWRYLNGDENKEE